jgi:hypothetical protein
LCGLGGVASIRRKTSVSLHWGVSVMTDHSNSEDPDLKLLGDYAEAVGILTVYWASLENALTSVIERLLRCDPTTARCIGASVEKAAGRAMLIQRLVLRPGESPADEWRDCMLGMCDQIANVLGPKRNRLIHDDWGISEDAVQRHNPGIRIGKAGERESKTLLTYEAAPSHVQDIWVLTGKVIDVAFHIVMVSWRYHQWKNGGPYAPLHERAILVSKGTAPERHLPDGLGPQPQPKPSPR